MTEKFDDMSKHMARKHSRRGLIRALGAGVLGATAAAALPTVASADWGAFRRGSYLRNTYGPQWYTVDNGQNQNVIGQIRWNQSLPNPGAD
ncbi:MAG: hypothetical protein AB7I38_06895 [Dehalococcoidia bacterium]